MKFRVGYMIRCSERAKKEMDSVQAPQPPSLHPDFVPVRPDPSSMRMFLTRLNTSQIRQQRDGGIRNLRDHSLAIKVEEELLLCHHYVFLEEFMNHGRASELVYYYLLNSLCLVTFINIHKFSEALLQWFSRITQFLVHFLGEFHVSSLDVGVQLLFVSRSRDDTSNRRVVEAPGEV